MALVVGKPLVIHSRDAEDDCLAILEEVCSALQSHSNLLLEIFLEPTAVVIDSQVLQADGVCGSQYKPVL